MKLLGGLFCLFIFLACGGNVEAEYLESRCSGEGSFGLGITAASLVGPTLNSLSGIMKKC